MEVREPEVNPLFSISFKRGTSMTYRLVTYVALLVLVTGCARSESKGSGTARQREVSESVGPAPSSAHTVNGAPTNQPPAAEPKPPSTSAQSLTAEPKPPSTSAPFKADERFAVGSKWRGTRVDLFQGKPSKYKIWLMEITHRKGDLFQAKVWSLAYFDDTIVVRGKVPAEVDGDFSFETGYFTSGGHARYLVFVAKKDGKKLEVLYRTIDPRMVDAGMLQVGMGTMTYEAPSKQPTPATRPGGVAAPPVSDGPWKSFEQINTEEVAKLKTSEYFSKASDLSKVLLVEREKKLKELEVLRTGFAEVAKAKSADQLLESLKANKRVTHADKIRWSEEEKRYSSLKAAELTPEQRLARSEALSKVLVEFLKGNASKEAEQEKNYREDQKREFERRMGLQGGVGR